MAIFVTQGRFTSDYIFLALTEMPIPRPPRCCLWSPPEVVMAFRT
jgi:hypothetical protein